MEDTLKGYGKKRQRNSSSIEEKEAKRTYIGGNSSEDAIVISDEESSVSIQQEILSKTFHSKCDNPYCREILHRSDSDGEKFQECHICLGGEEIKEVALLSECNHVFCAPCIKELHKMSG